MPLKNLSGISHGTTSKKVASSSLTGIYSDGYNIVSSGLGLARPEFDNIKSTSRLDFSGKLRWGGKWIPYRDSIRSAIPLGPPYYSFQAIHDLERISEDERSELIRFLLALKLWETTPGKKIITAAEVWINCLSKGPAYAEELDDLFSLTWREEEQESYNFSFPSRFLIRFEESSDDIKWSLISTYADEDTLEEFSETLDEILSCIEAPEIVLADDDAILEERTTTTSYSSVTENTLPHWEASFQITGFETKELEGKRCIVPVFPGGTRDTIIADKKANNSIRWIERSLKEILTYIPESASVKYTSVFHQRIQDVTTKRGYHVLRDIKKCGLTYNSRDLFPIVKKCLKKYWPDSRWDRIDIFQKMRVVDDDCWFEPVRGYGLGMANNLVTLCNIVVYYMVISKMKYSNRIKQFKSAAIIGNDDSDVAFYGRGGNPKEAAEEYLNLEHEVQGRLGNLTNMKKSVIKPYGLFYENYNKAGWRTKESLVCNALACAYLAPNIRTAKNYIFCQSDRFNSKWALAELKSLASHWGEEFFDVKSELEIHYEIGGWLDLRSLGLKTTLMDVEMLSKSYEPRYISWVQRQCEKYMSPPRPIFKERGFVHNSLYTGPAQKSDGRIQAYTLTESDLREYYKKLTTFQRNYSKRIEKFSTYKDSRVSDTALQVCVDLCRNKPWYCIPDLMSKPLSAWKSDIEIQGSSELCTADVAEQRPEMLIQRLLDKDAPEPNCLISIREDPMVPPDQIRNTVYCELGTVYASSQFSNSGALPLLEYFWRNRVLPDIPLIDGLSPKIVQRNSERMTLSLQTFSHHKKELERKTTTVEIKDVKLEDIWGYDENQQEEDQEECELEPGDFKDFANDFLDIPAQPELTNRDLDKILDIFDRDNEEEMGDFFAQRRRDAYAAANTASDNGFDDDEDMDFGLFGAE